jgi:cysteine-rich repeat protein
MEGSEECDDGNTDDTDSCVGSCVNASCGDSYIYSGVEECDDGNTDNTDSCTSSCISADCGDGIVWDGVEQCDGSDLAGETCSSRGYTGGTLSCSAACSFVESACTFCGDDTIDLGETCDGTALGGQTCTTQGFDGGTLACNGTCTGYLTSACYGCGDGNINPGEECDGSNLNGQTCISRGYTSGTLSCSATCSFVESACVSCGNGNIESGEECDDGDTSSGDGCDSSCQIETGYLCSGEPSICTISCGNGTVDIAEGEECDDNNNITEACAYGLTACTVCDATCNIISGSVSYCGDSSIDASNGETCDEGSSNGEPLHCNSTCTGITTSVCGNGTPEAGETCDDGDTITNTCTYGAASCSVCGETCQTVPGIVEYCGDGTLNGPETCEDGNSASGDGCSSSCSTEAGFVCVLNPSTGLSECEFHCGDNVVQTGSPYFEECDNGASSFPTAVPPYNGTACTVSAYGESCTYCATDCREILVTGRYCGDGTVDTDGGEQCDDGNLTGGDGCTNCVIDTGYVCTGVFSVCSTLCGDGLCAGAPNESCVNCPADCDICELGATTLAEEHPIGIFADMFQKIRSVFIKPEPKVSIPGVEFESPTLSDTSLETKVDFYDPGIRKQIEIGGEFHHLTIELLDSTDPNSDINFLLESVPCEKTLELGEEINCDVDGDGIDDVVVRYKSLIDGRPQIVTTKIKEAPVGGSQYIDSPFIPEYISAVYRYSVVVITILATIMLIIAGVQWTMSGGSPERIGSAQKIIVRSITGLLLAIGSYTILYTINPNLVKFQSLRILNVGEIPLGIPDTIDPYADEGNAEDLRYIESAEALALKGLAPLVSNDNINFAPGINRTARIDVVKAFERAVAEYGGDVIVNSATRTPRMQYELMIRHCGCQPIDLLAKANVTVEMRKWNGTMNLDGKDVPLCSRLSGCKAGTYVAYENGEFKGPPIGHISGNALDVSAARVNSVRPCADVLVDDRAKLSADVPKTRDYVKDYCIPRDQQLFIKAMINNGFCVGLGGTNLREPWHFEYTGSESKGIRISSFCVSSLSHPQLQKLHYLQN